jgi:hypothetical protein
MVADTRARNGHALKRLAENALSASIQDACKEPAKGMFHYLPVLITASKGH